AALAGLVDGVRALEHETFVAARAGGVEGALELLRRRGAGRVGEEQPSRRRGGDRFEPRAAVAPRLFEERPAADGETVVRDERGRNLGEGLRRRRLAPQAPLKAEEGVGPAFGRPPRDDLAVEQELPGHGGERRGDLGKLLRHLVQSAREERDARFRLVRVRADAVELVLDGEERELLRDLRRVLDGRGEHEADRMEESEADRVETSLASRARRLADVARVAARPRDGLP